MNHTAPSGTGAIGCPRQRGGVEYGLVSVEKAALDDLSTAYGTVGVRDLARSAGAGKERRVV